MRKLHSGRIPTVGLRRAATLLCLVALPAGLWAAATESPRMPVVSKWHRFEESFKSSVLYSNALQDATLTIIFTSPVGETNLVYGFWDGERTWRVRFAPDQPGRWTYTTTCSDIANQGLHNRKGEFLCTAPAGLNRFHRHGPIHVARDRRHLEHADGTPFFWLADTAWDTPRAAEPKDWEFYITTRALQQFTVVQWAAAPGEDIKGLSAITGFPDRIGINPEYFQQLDARLAIPSQAGMLSAITPFLELEGRQAAMPALSDDQVALLVRYMVARWGADPVAWLLAFDGSSPAKLGERWQRIGKAVFTEGRHAPTVVYPGAAPTGLEAFRDQKWVDMFGGQSMADFSDKGLEQALAGPLFQEWTGNPQCPVIPFLPRENAVAKPSNKRFTADDVRRAAYWSLLEMPAAGVSYSAEGVAHWDRSAPLFKETGRNANLPLWKRSLFMPAAKQMSHLAGLMESADFWRLRPLPKAVAAKPGATAPRDIAAAGTESKDLAMVYLPGERSIELATEALPPSATASWINVRTGDSAAAAAAVAGGTCQFPTPAPGDWLLLVTAGSKAKVK